MFELRVFERDGHAPFQHWMRNLRDPQARARIRTRLDRLRLGNAGQHRNLGGGVSELKIDCGPGYRVYYGQVGAVVLLLLCGGDKSRQQEDIEQAQSYLKEYLDEH